MAEESLPEAKLVDAVKANRSDLESFAYVQEIKKSSRKEAIWALGLSVLALALVFLRDTPTKENVGELSGFSVPEMGAKTDAADPNVYNKAQDAKNIAQKNRAKGFAVGLTVPKLISRPRNVKVPAGTFVKAVLLTGASNGLVKAELKEEVAVNGETYAPAGSVVVGQGNSTQERLLVQFTKLIHQDGTSESIQAVAADKSDKTAGLKGSRVGQQALKLAAGIGLNFLGGMSEGLQDTTGQQGVAVRTPSVKNALLNGAAKASIEQSNDLMSEVRNSQPIIQVDAGIEIYVLFADSGE
jgi:hypothetical protein